MGCCYPTQGGGSSGAAQGGVVADGDEFTKLTETFSETVQIITPDPTEAETISESVTVVIT